MARQGLLGKGREGGRREMIKRLRAFTVTKARSPKEHERINRACEKIANEIREKGEGRRP